MDQYLNENKDVIGVVHYLKLIEAHRDFYGNAYHKAYNYDEYFEDKCWETWENPHITVDEISKLFKFIKSWDRFFQGDVKKFQRIYAEIHPVLVEMWDLKIEEVGLEDKEFTVKIRDVFHKVAKCTLIDRYESTDASKILHTVIPDFFVMWDDKIKDGLVQGRSMGATYAFFFLKIAQDAINEAIQTCMDEKGLERSDAIQHIRDACDGKSLAKLVDQYHFLKYTKNYPDF